MQEAPPRKYYLSKTACLGILRRARERGKELPPQLKAALMAQAGLIPLAAPASEPIAFAANQRDEVRNLHDVAGALGAQPGMKQQTFIAQDCLTPWDTQQARIFTPESKAPTLASADGGGGRNPGGLLFTAGLTGSLSTHVQLWEATDFSENMIRETRKRSFSGRLHFSVQDATNLPYVDSSFDAVVIANALHIMPNPERALSEIRRVLKPGGLLYAPTFVHGKGAGFRLRMRLLSLAGFRVYSPWTAGAFVDYISGCGFEVTKTELLGKSLAPLCYLEAKSTKNEGDRHG